MYIYKYLYICIYMYIRTYVHTYIHLKSKQLLQSRDRRSEAT